MVKMKNKLLIIITIIMLITFTGCKPQPTPPIVPTPVPTLPIDYIAIPSWVDSPEMIAHWNKILGITWTSDETTTGYANYYFTPIELTLAKIPDVNNPKRTIEKTPYQGDCDDMAKWNGYLSYVVMHTNPYIIHFLIGGNIHLAHAIVYGIADGKYHFFDNHTYRGAWDSVKHFMEAKYPGYIIYFHEPLKDVLERLYKEGHLEYAPVEPESKKSPSKKKDCEDDVCPL
jgi:hypothetical protein